MATTVISNLAQFADFVGGPNQGLMVWAANQQRWWSFYLKTKTSTVVSCSVSNSSDPTSGWSTSTDSPAFPSSRACSANDRRNIAALGITNTTTDAVHVMVGIGPSSNVTGYVEHIRAAFSGSSTITWDSWVETSGGSTTWELYKGNALGIGTTGFVHEGGLTLDSGEDAAARRSTNADTTATWTNAWGAKAVIDSSIANQVESYALGQLASANMLCIYDNGGSTTPNCTGLRFNKYASGTTWPTTGSADVGIGTSTQDKNDWCSVSLGPASNGASFRNYVFRRDSNTAILTRYYDSSFNTPTNAVPAYNVGSSVIKATAGIACSTDGWSIWLFVVDNGSNNPIYYIKGSTAQGTITWGTWTLLEAAGSAARTSIGCNNRVWNGTIVVTYSTVNGSNFDFTLSALTVSSFAIPQVVSSTNDNPGGTVNSFTVTWGFPTQVGDLLFCAATFGSASANPGAITPPSPWVQLGTTQNNGAGCYVALFWCTAAAMQMGVKTFTTANNVSTISCVAYDLSGVGQQDSSFAVNTGSGTTITGGSLTTTNANDIVLLVAAQASSGSASIGLSAPSSGFTLPTNGTASIANSSAPKGDSATGITFDMVTATNTFAPTLTSSQSLAWVGITIAFMPGTASVYQPILLSQRWDDLPDPNLLWWEQFRLQPLSTFLAMPPCYRQASQRFDPLPDYTYSWWEQFRFQPVPLTFLAMPPAYQQKSQRWDDLPNFWQEWEAYTEVPYAPWYAPTAPATCQPSQRWDALPDWWSEWYPQRQPPSSTTFVAPLPPSSQPSQRFDAQPDFWQEWTAYVEKPYAPWYSPPLPPSRQSDQRQDAQLVFDSWWEQFRQVPLTTFLPPARALSQRWDDLPDYNSWWEQFRLQPVPVAFLAMPPCYRQGSQQTDAAADATYSWWETFLPPVPAAVQALYVQPSQRQDAQFDWWQEWEAFQEPKLAAWFVPPLPPSEQSSQRWDPAIDFDYLWWEQHRTQPVPVRVIVDSPPTAQPSQRWDALPDFTSWWEQFRRWPVAVEYIPTPPMSHQLSQRFDALPVFDALWWEQFRLQPVPVSFVPTAPPTRQASQRFDPLPDWTTTWWAYPWLDRRVPVPSSVRTTQEGVSGAFNVIIMVGQAGYYRVQNDIAGWNLWVGVNAPPDLTGTPLSFSTSLPFSSPSIAPPVSGTEKLYVLVTKQDHYGLNSTNQDYEFIVVDSAGNQVLGPFGPPQSLSLFLAPNDSIRVLATYPNFATDEFPGTAWKVWISTTPPNISVDAPVATVPVMGKILVSTTGPYAAGLWYVAVALYRANDTALSAPVTGQITMPPNPGEVVAVPSGFDIEP